MLWNLREITFNVHASRVAPRHAYSVAEKVSTEVWDIYLQAGIGLLHTLAHSHTCFATGQGSLQQDAELASPKLPVL